MILPELEVSLRLLLSDSNLFIYLGISNFDLGVQFKSLSFYLN